MEQSLLINTTISHYRILSRIGAGGMGEVYLAEDARLGRKVALKLLPAQFTADPDRVRRFEQEARAASALNHPNIITIYEIGEERGIHYIVTEFIAGHTLRASLAQGPVTSSEMIDLSMQAASALAAAHGAGVIHRDIKPENIMLRADGLVKVLDFGLAKLVEKQPAEVDTNAPTAAKVMTDPGTVMGTVHYMSPEQASGLKDVDERTDIWSLGVVMYEMVARRVPFGFDGATPTQIISLIIQKAASPLKQFAPQIPDELQRIVMKALENKREDRYQSLKEMLLDLRRLNKQLEREAEQERVISPEPGSDAVDKARVATTQEAAMQTSGVGVTHSTSSAEYIVSRIKRHKTGVISVLAALVIALAVGSYFYFGRGSQAAIGSIAVLPFVNDSPDPNAEYLSDGIAESLMNSLSQLPNLKVISRNTAFSYKGKEQDAKKIGHEWNVGAVVTGSVKQVGDQIVIRVSLDDAGDSHQIWGDQYTRKFADILTVQRDIAQEISSNLRLKLTGAEQQQLAKHYTDNVEAHQLYLKGQYEWKKFTQEDLQKSIDYYNQALAKDPNYALAYAGLSSSYLVLGNSYLPPNEAFPTAKAYATRALELDETLAEAHMVMGGIRLLYDWNWAEAERELKRAQALNPNDAAAHDLYGYYLKAMGRLDEAKAETKRAQELDPLAPMINTDVGVASYYARQYDEAIAQIEKTINLDPHFFIAYLWLGQAYEQKKMYAEAMATFQKGMDRAERHPQLVASLGRAYALAGQPDRAHQALDELREMSKRRYVSPYLMAVVYAGLGDQDQAFTWLNKAYDERTFFLIWLKVEPRFDGLRSDPRFADLVRRIGL